jgi:hypothetical protein
VRIEAQGYAGRVASASFLSEYCYGLEPSTVRMYETPVWLFIRDFAGVQLAAIDRPTVRAWCVKQSRTTVNVIRTMFNHAHRDGLVRSIATSAAKRRGKSGLRSRPRCGRLPARQRSARRSRRHRGLAVTDAEGARHRRGEPARWRRT